MSGGTHCQGDLPAKAVPKWKGGKIPTPEVFNSRAMAAWQGYSEVGLSSCALNRVVGPDLPDVEQVVRLLTDEVGVEQQVAVAPKEVTKPLGIHRHQL